MSQASAVETAQVAPDWKKVGEAILTCIRERDFERLAESFHPHVACRLLIPSSLATPYDAATLVNYFRKWFGDADIFNIEDFQIAQVGDRLHVGYRFRVREDGLWYTVEQQTFSRLESGKIVRF